MSLNLTCAFISIRRAMEIATLSCDELDSLRSELEITNEDRASKILMNRMGEWGVLHDYMRCTQYLETPCETPIETPYETPCDTPMETPEPTPDLTGADKMPTSRCFQIANVTIPTPTMSFGPSPPEMYIKCENIGDAGVFATGVWHRYEWDRSQLSGSDANATLTNMVTGERVYILGPSINSQTIGEACTLRAYCIGECAKENHYVYILELDGMRGSTSPQAILYDYKVWLYGATIDNISFHGLAGRLNITYCGVPMSTSSPGGTSCTLGAEIPPGSVGGDPFNITFSWNNGLKERSEQRLESTDHHTYFDFIDP